VKIKVCMADPSDELLCGCQYKKALSRD
jgi:hypothetical protein